MAEAILGMRGSGSFSESERPTNFREKIFREYPNGPAVFLMILGMLKSEGVNDTKFTIFEQSFPDQVHNGPAAGNVSQDVPGGGGTPSAGGAGSTATDTVIYLGTVKYTAPSNFFKVGHLVRNETTGEVMAVIGKDSTLAGVSLEVVRGVGFSATYGDGSGAVGTGLLIDNDDTFTIIGSFHPEGSNYPLAVHYQPTERWNFIETFRTSLELTDDAMQTYYRTGKILDNAKYDAAMMHSMEMEKAFLWGKRERLDTTYADLVGRSTTQPQRSMGGLDFFINHKQSFSGGLTAVDFLDFLEPIYTIPGGSQNKVAFCGSRVLGVMTQYAESLGQIFLEPGDKTYGLQIRTLIHAWGELKLVNHPLMSEHPIWTNNMFIIDTKNVMYRYLDGRDTRFLKDRQGNGEDKVVHEFMTKCSLELRHPRTHGIATDITNFVA
jgi:hypothetical protein